MYNFHIANNHFIAEIDEKSYIIDTGSPMSLRIGHGPGTVTVNGQEFSLSNLGNYVGLRQTEKLIGEKIDGLLGNDVLTALGSVNINKEEGTVEFGGSCDFNPQVQLTFSSEQQWEDFDSASGAKGGLVSSLIDMLGGAESVNRKLRDVFGISGDDYLLVDINLGGKHATAVFDTGACISYAIPELLADSPVTGQTEDWQPGKGTIRATEHETDLEMGNLKTKAFVSEADASITAQLRLLGAQAVIGPKHFPYTRLLIDFRGGKLLAA